jgi:hypothetical protein
MKVATRLSPSKSWQFTARNVSRQEPPCRKRSYSWNGEPASRPTQTVPYRTDLFLNPFQAVNCLDFDGPSRVATFIPSLTRRKRRWLLSAFSTTSEITTLGWSKRQFDVLSGHIASCSNLSFTFAPLRDIFPSFVFAPSSTRKWGHTTS